MNGLQDMGGMQCYGRVVTEENEPLFHHDWERNALAITLAAGFCGMWNLDRSRHARETLPPRDYLGFSYYQIWIAALEKLLIGAGMVEAQELTDGKASLPAIKVRQVLDGDGMAKALAAGGPSLRSSTLPSRFAKGERVRTVKFSAPGHSRLPRYARNAVGQVKLLHGCHVFPDANAHGLGEHPQHLYTIEFAARDLFGPGADERDRVCVDCWEPYLEKA